MNQEMLTIFKKAFEFALDDPEGTSLDEALTSMAEYLHDELAEDIGDEGIDELYPILSGFMKAIYEE